MIPYSEFYYFYIMAIVLIPCIVLGILQKKIKWYGLILTIFMLYLIFGDSIKQLQFLIVFFIVQLLLVK